jgi:hypothetical protein
MSFLISQHFNVVWHVELFTGHFALPPSLLYDWRGCLSPLGPHGLHPPLQLW